MSALQVHAEPTVQIRLSTSNAILENIATLQAQVHVLNVLLEPIMRALARASVLTAQREILIRILDRMRLRIVLNVRQEHIV